MKLTLKNPELSHLQGCIDKTLNFVGGPDLPYYLVSTKVLLSCTGKDLSFAGDVLFSDLQGYPNEFSFITINESARSDLKRTLDAGLQYFFMKGQRITGVEILEETVESHSQTKLNWSLTSDIAVIFTLTHGVIVISKLSHHDEALRVLHGPELGSIEIPATQNFFETDLFERVTTTRRLMNLETAMERN
jgi:hypothetical protein